MSSTGLQFGSVLHAYDGKRVELHVAGYRYAGVIDYRGDVTLLTHDDRSVSWIRTERIDGVLIEPAQEAPWRTHAT